MSDIVAQLQVLSQESGCLIDLTAILDLSICPKIDVKSQRPHKVEQQDDYICVTPTDKVQKRCPSGNCYEVSEQVCQKPTVALDLELLVLLGLLTEEQCEQYMKTTGAMGQNDNMDVDNDDVGMDPLLSADVGKDNELANVNLGGKKNPILNVDVGKDGHLLDVDGLLNLHLRRSDGVLDLDVGGQRDQKQAAIDIDVAQYDRRADGTNGLLDVDVGGEKDDKPAAIDVDVLTHGKQNGNGNNGNGNGSNGNGNGNNGSGNGNGSGSGSGNNGNGNGNNGQYDGSEGRKHRLSHYQPMCNKGFKKEHKDHAQSCHATDVNHCLAICHQQAALLTIDANVQVGDVANILVCAAISLDQSSQGDNCHYFVAPETEPCHDDQLEEDENCYTFVRN